MGTGISNVGLAAAAALIFGLAGCGTSRTSPFGWFHPQPPPSGWKATTIRSGATMAYPPTWRPQHGDAGTVTAALLRPGGGYLGYLNLTPRQGPETLANWSSFRTNHNGDEGDRDVKRLAFATGLHFLTGHGSCVKDSYTTAIGSRFVEIACLIAGAHTQSVIVAAAPPQSWAQVSGTLERAIEAVRT